jgi:hypothetical protein
MARVRVNTAGASEFSLRVDIPYLDHQIASGLAHACQLCCNTAFRW